MRNLVKVENNLKEVKNVLKKIRVVLLALAMLFSLGSMVFAATDNPITVVNNLSDFMFGLIRAIGMILIGFGVVQIGLSLKSHDASQRANGFMTLAGGVVVTFAKEILDMIVG
jgi:hypothetical protein